MDYKVYTLHNYRNLPQIDQLTEAQKFAIDVVGRVLPFKTNNYVTNELIDWNHFEDDPIFNLNFPSKEMLKARHFNKMADIINLGASREQVRQLANQIRAQLNPHPAGQLRHNVPEFKGERLSGIQHKYRETVLFFPNQGQTCHAYCTFCFRWPQFTGMKELKFGMKQADLLTAYIKAHPEVSDLLFTGGDPLIMNATTLGTYINALLETPLPHLQNIRMGTKALSFWPYRFLTDKDADELIRLFEKIIQSGRHLTIMAHFSHPRELQTQAVKDAIQRIRNTGAQIRTQSPVLNHINAHPNIWADMWKEQVKLGMVPYYMFVPRETGAQQYFALPLIKLYHIFREAYQQVSGIARTVRGPSMSAHPGKIQILGTSMIYGEKVFVLRFIQGRDPEWVLKPFFARYNPYAMWIDDLKPAFGESAFFYEKDSYPHYV